MTDQPPPELFVRRPVRSALGRSGPSYAVRRVLTVCVLLLMAAAIGYWAFHRRSVSTPEMIPTIKTEGTYKQRPQQPGGIDIPHQDVQVYQQLDNSPNDKSQIEHLLPPPEVPQQGSVPPATSSAPVPLPAAVETIAPRAMIEPTVPDVAPVNPPAPVASMPFVAPANVSVTVPVQHTGAVPPVAPDLPAPSASDTPVAVAPLRTTVIQLGSIPDKKEAVVALGRLQSKYAALLGSSQLRVVKADLGSRGVYFRIQSPPLSKDQANGICLSAKQHGDGCIVVKP